MRTIIVTGGIGCGKTMVSKALCSFIESGGAFRFSADEAVHLAYESPSVRERIARAVGIDSSAAHTEAPEFRSLVRQKVMADEHLKKAIEQVLHPLVRRDFTETRQKTEAEGLNLLVAEIPLYYETGTAFDGDVVLVVAASRSTQLHRLQIYRSFDRETAEKMLLMQMPMEEKVQKANFVIWNDGSLDALKAELLILHQAVSK